MTAVDGNASVYQVNPVSRITGEGRAEFLRTWRPGFDQKGAGVGGGTGGGTGGAAHFVRGKYKSFQQGDNSDGFGKNAPVYHGTGGGRDGRGSSICAWKLCIL